MCKCKSYNTKVKGAKHPNVILEVPKHLRTKRLDGTEQRTIAVDKCMAKRLVSLWAAGLQTMNCCCGHNKFMPTIIIPDDACLYNEEELEEELYIADGIEHGLFEVEPAFDSIPGYYSY